MDKETAWKIINKISRNILSNEEFKQFITQIYGEDYKKIGNLHRKINGSSGFSYRNQYILEAFSVVRGFKSKKWFEKKDLDNLKFNIEVEPVFFAINSSGKIIEYQLFNEDQIPVELKSKIIMSLPKSKTKNLESKKDFFVSEQQRSFVFDDTKIQQDDNSVEVYPEKNTSENKNENFELEEKYKYFFNEENQNSEDKTENSRLDFAEIVLKLHKNLQYNEEQKLNTFKKYEQELKIKFLSNTKHRLLGGIYSYDEYNQYVLTAHALVNHFESFLWDYKNNHKILKGDSIELYSKTKGKNFELCNIDQIEFKGKVSNLKVRRVNPKANYRKFSGGYSGLNPNFILTQLPQKNSIAEAFYNYLLILENMLCRGCPTKPFETLELEFEENVETFYYFDENQNLDWSVNIKGGSTYKPALDFYQNLKKRFPMEWMFFLPECPFIDIVNDGELSHESAVDFYDPFHKIVVEIDGHQHREASQKLNDAQRDEKLKENGVFVVRIPTGKDFEPYMQKIEQKINTLKLFKIEKPNEDQLIKAYLFRFQIALIEAFKMGYADITKICLKLAHPFNKEYFQKAYLDLNKTLFHLSVLGKTELKLIIPEIEISDHFDQSDNVLNVDIDPLSLYDQNTFKNIESNTVIVRSDYFPYTDMNNLDYSCQKNYFYIESSEYRFSQLDLRNKVQGNSLTYFLKNIFGFEKFRANQKDIIVSALKPEKGVIGLLPTGAGKSICFQLVGLLTPGITIVVSPLTSLMQDQCNNLIKRHGITNAVPFFASKEAHINLKSFADLNTKFLYVSPERFFNKEFKEMLAQCKNKIAQIVIDEVHCLSEWGHDFRTSYLLLFGILKQQDFSKNLLIMGTSGTSSFRVTDDISKEFQKLDKVVSLIKAKSNKRKELIYSVKFVKSEEEKGDYIKQCVQENSLKNEKTLIFAPFKPDVNAVKKLLSKSNNEENFTEDFDVEIQNTVQMESNKEEIHFQEIEDFKGDEENKNEKIEAFKNASIKTIIATKAFGMGLDIPDIRNVYHYYMSSSVESCYQEMGRAGRDGKKSNCCVLFYKGDKKFNFDTEFQKYKNNLNRLNTEIWNKKGKYFCEAWKQLALLTRSNSDAIWDSKFVYLIYDFLRKKDGLDFDLKEAFESLAKEFETRHIPLDSVLKKSKPDYESFLIRFEQGLYRLYNLGFIGLWTKTYSSFIENPSFSLIHLVKREPKELKKALEDFIRKYDLSFTCDDLDENIKYSEFVFKILQKECNWLFENFFEYHWKSLKTLYEWLYDFKSSEEFAEHIDQYFSSNKTLEDAVRNEGNYLLWFNAIHSEEAKVLKDQLSKYMEGYRNNLAVDYISGIVRLKLDDFNCEDGKGRLKKALLKIQKDADKELDSILRNTFELLSSYEKLFFILFLKEDIHNLFKNNIVQEVFKNFSKNQKIAFKNREKYKKIDRILTDLEKVMEEKYNVG